MELLTSSDWTDYELIDTGNREKLERFGKYILIRPEPQAVWPKAMPEEEWDKLHHARFSRGKSESLQSTAQSQQTNTKAPRHQGTTAPQHHSTTAPQHHSTTAPQHHSTTAPRKEERGEWIRKPEMPDQWMIWYSYKEMHLKFRLGLTAFGHIGVFPEQAENWKFVYDAIQLAVGSRQLTAGSSQSAVDSGQLTYLSETRNSKPETSDQNRSEAEFGGANPGSSNQKPETSNQDPGSRMRVLNLFAYTGGSSMAAKAAGADVTHVDSVKPVINWAREDMEISGMDGIRWVIEDAMKFVRREVKRGNRYDGIILDPPAYGRGPDGEKWILEESIDEMITLCAELLSPQSTVGSPQLAVGSPQSPFFILSLYSMGFSSLIGENLVKSHFGSDRNIQSGEFCFSDRAGKNLPLGTFARLFLHA